MQRCNTRAHALILISLLLPLSVRADSCADYFEARIRPLLADQCYGCHTETAKGELRLDSRAAMLRGGKSGPALVPGSPEKSLLYQAVARTHERLKMPPKKPLPSQDIAALKRWIREGAVWPEATPATVVKKSGMRSSHWAYQPVQSPKTPTVSKEEWSRNPIDAFIFAKLTERELKPGGPASRRELIRRATYDLLGLPPTPEEVEAFVEDDSPKAFEKVIERLLKSRHYGERWGRHWLDLVRYADTAGDAADYPIPEAYKYRNYVIDAFNNDLRYDRFIREQIAGDLLTWSNDEERWRQIIATGYLAISRRIGVSPHMLRHITIEDTIDNLGKTFLGLTIGCARCHDHKFDAIPTTDYYALYGIFDSTIYPHAGAEHKPYREGFVYRVGEERAGEILKPFREKLRPWDRRERAKYAEYREPQVRKITTPGRTREVVWNELLRVREQRAEVARTFPPMEIAYAVREGEARDAHVQRMGDPESRGEKVRRGFLRVLGGQQLPEGYRGSGRRALADWIADPNNPLTARVMVNRIWHHHFGRGLVRTTSDFGVRGTMPTHPELLDYLARYFIEHGWSIKKMHRLIMSSRTYQLSSASIASNSNIDQTNRYYWRGNRHRLDAEQIRDSILSYGGRLDLSPGERHPFPHRLTYFYRQHEPFQEKYPTNRRSVYLMQQRIQKDVYLDLFDGPDGNIPLPERKATTTTLQSLYLMNSEFMHEQSQSIAERLLSEGDTTEERVQWAYQMIFGRPASREESERAQTYLRRAQSLIDQPEEESERMAWAGYVRGMISSNAHLFVE